MTTMTLKKIISKTLTTPDLLLTTTTTTRWLHDFDGNGIAPATTYTPCCTSDTKNGYANDNKKRDTAQDNKEDDASLHTNNGDDDPYRR